MSTLCPCDSGKAFAQCCQSYLDNHSPTAEALMRSRYTAYTLQNAPTNPPSQQTIEYYKKQA